MLCELLIVIIILFNFLFDAYAAWILLIWNAWDQMCLGFEFFRFWNICISITGWTSLIQKFKIWNALKSESF
jgi:hypothetical protein